MDELISMSIDDRRFDAFEHELKGQWTVNYIFFALYSFGPF